MKSGKRIVLFTLFAINLVDQPAPEVRIEQGILSGKVSADGSFFEYVGIPYASTNSRTRFKVSFACLCIVRHFIAMFEIVNCSFVLVCK